jgi:hypothetical protein
MYRDTVASCRKMKFRNLPYFTHLAREGWAPFNPVRISKTYSTLWGEIFFFSFVFLCSKEHFSIFLVQYLGVTAGIEPAT